MTTPAAPILPLRVLGSAGSLRAGSYNRALLRAAVELAPEAMVITVFDLSGMPPFNADVEALGDPPPVLAFKAAIAHAHALLIVTPEYNYSLPGVLKNALDWASRPAASSVLNGKPLAMMGASTGLLGTVRAQLHLRQVCVFTNMLPLNRPEVFVTRAAGKFDATGRLTDEETRQRVRTLLDALIAWADRLGVDRS